MYGLPSQRVDQLVELVAQLLDRDCTKRKGLRIRECGWADVKKPSSRSRSPRQNAAAGRKINVSGAFEVLAVGQGFRGKKIASKRAGREGYLPSLADGGGIFSKILFLRLRVDCANPILDFLVKFFTS